VTANGSRGGRVISGVALAVAVIAVIGAVTAAGEARAGELVYKDCISADGVIGPSGRPSCTRVGSAHRRAFAQPLNSLALSPDSRSLYSGTGIWCHGLTPVICSTPAAVGHFHRDAVTGALDYRSC